jgi:hypothetical protein
MWKAYFGQTIHLDTNIIIFAGEAGNPWMTALRGLFTAIDRQSIAGVTSELTLAEVLAKPLAQGKNELIAKYDRMLSENSVISVAVISRGI